MRFVIDTNVPVVANRRSEQASTACVWICVRCLWQITLNGKVVLDDGWRLIGEYIRNLRSDGQPGVGDAFLKWVLTNWKNPNRCELVTISPTQRDNDFREFPKDPALKRFDPSDRKFVATALGHPKRPPILQAIDWKWWHLKNALRSNGVRVRFLCKVDIQRIAGKKARGISANAA